MTLRARTFLASMAALAALCLAACKNNAESAAPNEALTNEPERTPLRPSDPSLTAPSESGGTAAGASTGAAADTASDLASETAPREFEPQTDPEEIDGWRPQWWLEDPMKTQAHAVACAYATSTELGAARAAAVDSARQKLTQYLGYAPGVTEMKTDALRTPAGEYRAFVLIRTALK